MRTREASGQTCSTEPVWEMLIRRKENQEGSHSPSASVRLWAPQECLDGASCLSPAGREPSTSERFPNQMECKILVRAEQPREESTACVQVIYHL